MCFLVVNWIERISCNVFHNIFLFKLTKLGLGRREITDDFVGLLSLLIGQK